MKGALQLLPLVVAVTVRTDSLAVATMIIIVLLLSSSCCMVLLLGVCKGPMFLRSFNKDCSCHGRTPKGAQIFGSISVVLSMQVVLFCLRVIITLRLQGGGSSAHWLAS